MKKDASGAAEPTKREQRDRSEIELARLLAQFVDGAGSDDPEGFLNANPEARERLATELDLFNMLGSIIDGPEALQTYGDFDLIRYVAGGGMGLVYEARQRSLDRRVALKVLPAGLVADPRSRERFHREAKLAASLHHPNIVGVLTMGSESGVPYYTMELSPGKTLDRVLNRLPKDWRAGKSVKETDEDITRRWLAGLSHLFTPRDGGMEIPLKGREKRRQPPAAGTGKKHGTPRSWRKVPIAKLTQDYCKKMAQAFAGAAEGLDHAHFHGVIHRDLKPSNLILEPNGELRILDFGLAWAHDLPHITRTNEFPGTPAYMSPEQAQKQPDELGPPTDIFSLGVTMYEMAAWRTPFRADTPQETMNRVVHREPTRLRRVNPDIPKDFETIVDKCLAKDPRTRFGTAEALAQELRRFARGDPIETPPTTTAMRVARRAWRSRRHIAEAAGICILGLFAAFFWIDSRKKYQSQREKDYSRNLNEAVMEQVIPAGFSLPQGVHVLDSNRVDLVEHGDELSFIDPPRGGAKGGYQASQALYEAGPSLVNLGPDLVQSAMRKLEVMRKQFPEKGQTYYYLAKGKAQLGRTGEAIADVSQALERSPGLIPAKAFLVCLLRRDGREDAAERELEKVRAAGDESHLRLQSWIRAHQAEFEHDWEGAATAYEELADDPADEDILDVLLSRGIARFRTGRFQEASRDFTQAHEKTLASEKNRERLEPSLLLGKTLYFLGHGPEAKKQFDTAYNGARSPRERDQIALWIALTYKEGGENDKAQSWCDQVNEPMRKFLLRTEILSSSGEHDQAVAAAEEALRKAASNEEALAARLLLGNARAAGGDFDRAQAEFEVAARESPEDARALVAWGSCLEARGDENLDAAEEIFSQAVNLDRGLAAAHYGLATVRRKKGTLKQDQALLDSARQSYKECLRLDPLHAAARNNLGLLFDRERRLDEAMDEYRKATLHAPNLAAPHYNYGSGLLRQERFREAAEAFEKAIALGLRHSVVYFNLGVCLSYVNANEAIRVFDAAIMEGPESFEAYYGRGVAHEYCDRLDNALTDYHKSVQLNPNWCKSQNALQYVLYCKGETERSIEHGRKAIELDPTYPGSYLDLAKTFLEASRPIPEGDALAGEVRLFERAEHLVPPWLETLFLLEKYRKKLLPRCASYASIDWLLASPITVVPEGAVWKLFPGREEPPADWMIPTFDDSAWQEEPAGFGSRPEDDVPTVLEDMSGGNYLSIYVRHRFRVEDPARFRQLILRVRANDGFIAYLNGVEVDRMRSGSPGEVRRFDAPADNWTNAPWVTWRIPIAAMLLQGENVLAVQGTSFVAPKGHDFALHPFLEALMVIDEEAERRQQELLDAFVAAPHTEALAAYFEGRIRQLQGDLNQAELLFRRVLDLDPSRPEPYIRLAECLRLQGQAETGARFLAQAIESELDARDLTPDLWDAWFSFYIEKDPAEALEELPRRKEDTPRGFMGDRGEDLRALLTQLAAGEPFRIDCGPSLDRITADGTWWSRDRFARGGHPAYVGQEDIRKPVKKPPDVPYATIRPFYDKADRFPAYRIPLPAGKYNVTLHFMEGKSKREDMTGRFDVLLEGEPRLRDFAPIASGFGVAVAKQFVVLIVDGALDIDVHRLSYGAPSFAGIEVERIDEP